MNNKFEPSSWANMIVDLFKNIGYIVNNFGFISGKVLLNIFTVLAPAVAPAGPAIMFSANFYSSAVAEVAPQWALWSAIAVGLALECAGIVAAKTAIRWLGEWRNDKEARTKMWLAISIVVVYFFAGIGTTQLENTPPSMKWLTFISFVIALIAYSASALWEDAEKLSGEQSVVIGEEKEIEDARRQFDLEEERKDREAKRLIAKKRQEMKFELAKMQATQPVAQPVLVPKQEQVGYTGWRDIPHEERIAIASKTVKQISEENPSITVRSASNWLKYAIAYKAEHESN